MAYVERVIAAHSSANSTSLQVSIPETVNGDVLVVYVGQDHATAATFSTPSAPWVLHASNTAGGVGYYIATITDTGTGIPPMVVTSSRSDGWQSYVLVIKDADATASPVDAFALATSSDPIVTPPALTTTTDDCLLLLVSFNDASTLSRFDEKEATMLGGSTDGGITVALSYRQGGAAGLAPAILSTRHMGSTNTTVAYMALKNKINGAKPTEARLNKELLVDHPGRTYSILKNWITADIDGVPAFQGTYTQSPFNVARSEEWDITNNLTTSFTAPIAVSSTLGWYTDIATKDIENKLLSFGVSCDSVVASRLQNKGLFLLLGDALGNWAAYNFASKLDLLGYGGLIFTAIVDLKLPPTSTSTTPPNLAAITRVGIAYVVAATTTNATITIPTSSFFAWDSVELFGGGPTNPTTLVSGASILRSHFFQRLFSAGSYNQISAKIPLILGKSGEKTFFISKEGASSVFNDKLPGGLVSSDTFQVTLNVQAGDVFNIEYASIASPEGATIIIPAATPTNGELGITNSIFTGLEFDWRGNVACTSCQFFKGKPLQHGDGQFVECAFSGAIGFSAVITPSPDKFERCTFTQGTSGGHAIEITQPGTFSFVGNTFEGYGLDGTTDAAIYNNSGGHIILNVSGGGDTPTVRNGAGATTDVVSGAQVSVVGLAAGSQVKVMKVSNGDVLFNGAESGGQVSFSTTYIGAVRVDARKASSSPYYKPWFSQANTVSGQTVEITALQELDE